MGGVVGNVLAWLSVAAMATAGTPTFRCVCPNGDIKSHCAKKANPATGCCCKSSTDKDSGEASCCCNVPAQTPDPCKASPSAQHSCCAKSAHATPTPNKPPPNAPGITKPSCVQTFTAEPVV